MIPSCIMNDWIAIGNSIDDYVVHAHEFRAKRDRDRGIKLELTGNFWLVLFALMLTGKNKFANFFVLTVL